MGLKFHQRIATRFPIYGGTCAGLGIRNLPHFKMFHVLDLK